MVRILYGVISTTNKGKKPAKANNVRVTFPGMSIAQLFELQEAKYETRKPREQNRRNHIRILFTVWYRRGAEHDSSSAGAK
jgi:hypothetical protein